VGVCLGGYVGVGGGGGVGECFGWGGGNLSGGASSCDSPVYKGEKGLKRSNTPGK